MADQNLLNKLRGEVGKVLDRIASDPAYRQQVLDDPDQMLAAVGLGPSGDAPEVAGYAKPKCEGGGTCSVSCSWRFPNTCQYSCDMTR
jgi:hypothetical protein